MCYIAALLLNGLRDYGTSEWEGGDPDCDHKTGRFESPVSDKQKSNSGSAGHQARGVCPKCGAKGVDSQIGLEETPEQYIEKMVNVFREVKRVLRDDGTCWVNMGDSYTSSGKNRTEKQATAKSGLKGGLKSQCQILKQQNKITGGYKPKDLMGIPWRLALALQTDGWWLRSDIIWNKLNPMPSSVTDRPTTSHEYIFLLTKSARYYYDADAIAEKIEPHNLKRYQNVEKFGEEFDRLRHKHQTQVPGRGPVAQAPMDVLTRAAANVVEKGVRNKRTVWSTSTARFPRAHFAVFPEKLIKPCILAGCPKGGIVLDPFMGAGTTALVAKKLSCNYLGIELNPEYIVIANKRIAKEYSMF